MAARTQPVSGALASVGVPSEPAISQAISRNLTDKLYERRKLGALEIEQLVKDFKARDEKAKILELVRSVRIDFIESTSQNTRKGGLIAMAAVGLGLGQGIADYVTEIFPPVIGCFADPDYKVRYYACESLFNLAKIGRSNCLRFFNEIFDSLCKLAADPDKSCRDAAELLDRLMKDVVTEGGRFDVAKFIPLLAERVAITSAEVRRFLVSWIRLLDSIPEVELLQHLPHFLDGLIKMLSDKYEDIRQAVDTCLSEFLLEIKNTEEKWKIYRAAAADLPTSDSLASSSSPASLTPLSPGPISTSAFEIASPLSPSSSESMTDSRSSFPSIGSLQRPVTIHYGSMVNILIPHCRSKDEFTALTALHWLHEFVSISGDRFFPLCAKMLTGVLPQVSNKSPAIEQAARQTNRALKRLVKASNRQLPVSALLETITKQFKTEFIPTRIFSLKWILVLHLKNPTDLIAHLDTLFPILLKMLSDASEEVVRLDLEVLAKLSSNDAYFDKLVLSLVQLFKTNKRLLEGRATLIVRQLCLYIPAEDIYSRIAKILENDEDPQFASILVQTLNLVLLTATELVEVKTRLKSLALPQSRELFTKLYRSWSHNEAAVFSLCLLSQCYEHASNLVIEIANFEVTVNTLMEMDKLVQLLESPIFMSLRLQLLEPQRHPYLFKALYGLLMLLPQSSAFETLRNRLDSVASVSVLQSLPTSKRAEIPATSQSDVDFVELLDHFKAIRRKHQQHLVRLRLAEDKKAIKAAVEDAGGATNPLKPSSPRDSAALVSSSSAESHV